MKPLAQSRVLPRVLPRVLIVEDEAPLVTLLRYNLEREGFAVEAAADGEEALLRIAEGDRIRGLDSGADDYVVKPFSPSELVARLRAVIRRAQPNAADSSLDYADVKMDLTAHRVSRDGEPVHLGPTEFRLLRHFLHNPGRVFSREQLLDRVWGDDSEVEMRTVDVHIRRLRQALNAGGRPDLLRTVRSVGYALDRTG